MPQHDQCLLAPLRGTPPPAPAWFEAALEIAPQVARTVVEGAGIEYLVWGERGAPGLMLVHGGLAHARWWAHVAPLLATDRRVVALSLSGMGGSDWRERYSILQYGREIRAVAMAAGLAETGPPVVAGHSFGCAATLAAVADATRWAASAILIDGSISMKPGDAPLSIGRRSTPFPTVEAALARYRLIPAQPCDNPYIVDMIARASLRAVDGGWIRTFDPGLFERCTLVDSRALARSLAVQIAFVRGERSAIVPPAVYQGLRRDLPADTRFVEIPDAGHHVMIDQPLALVAAIRALLPVGSCPHPDHNGAPPQ